MDQPLYKLFAEVISGLRENDLEAIRAGLRQLASRKLAGASRDLFELISSRIESRYGELQIVSAQPPSGSDSSDRSLSELESRPLLPGYSIVSCCMNRNENLRRALETWVATSADEIVIVDWSSSTPVRDTVSDISDSRIRIIQVTGEPHWILTVAFNVGLRFASHEKVFKLDADITVKPDFFERNAFSSGEFVCGSWRIAQEKGREDQIYINGSFGAFKEDLKTIGFYNEDLRHYGWDDSDLYERLVVRARLKEKHLDIESVHHLEQCEKERTTHQEVTEGMFLGQVEASSFLITTNRYQARIFREWDPRLLQNFEFEQDGEQIWRCRRKTSLQEIPEHVVADARHYAALEHATCCAPKVFSSRANPKEIARMLHDDYTAGVPSDETLCLLGASDCFDQVYVSCDEAGLAEALRRLQSAEGGRNVAIIAPSLISDQERIRVTVGKSSAIVRLDPLWRLEMICTALDGAPENRRLVFTSSANTNGPGVGSTDFWRVVHEQPVRIASIDSMRRRIYIDCQHGLGNRLRAAASAAAMAAATDRELVIVWEPDEHCRCRFSDLFAYDGPVLEHALIDSLDPERFDLYNYIDIEPGGRKDEVINVGEKDIYARSAYVLNSDKTDWRSENEFLQQLKPAPEVLQLIPDMDPSMCIGVHIRSEGAHGSQERPYDGAHNYSEEGYGSIKYWRSQCHYSKFLAPIQLILDDEPGLKIFLATDLQETYEEMRLQFGSKLLCIDRPVFDRSREQLQYAMADMIALSRCKYLLGSHWSSFSELASRLSESGAKPKFCGLDF